MKTPAPLSLPEPSGPPLYVPPKSSKRKRVASLPAQANVATAAAAGFQQLYNPYTHQPMPFATQQAALLQPQTNPQKVSAMSFATRQAIAALQQNPTLMQPQPQDTTVPEDLSGDTADAEDPNTWNGVIKFRGKLMYSAGACETDDYVELNIMDYFSSLIYNGAKIVFDPAQHSPGTGENKFGKNPGWLALRKDLCAAARLQGAELMVGTTKERSGVLVCKRSKHYKDRRTEIRRKSTSSKPKSRDECCPFKFNVGANDEYFFLTCGKGCVTHKFHPKVPIEIPEEQEEESEPIEPAIGQIMDPIKEFSSKHLDGNPERIQELLDFLKDKSEQYEEEDAELQAQKEAEKAKKAKKKRGRPRKLPVSSSDE